MAYSQPNIDTDIDTKKNAPLQACMLCLATASVESLQRRPTAQLRRKLKLAEMATCPWQHTRGNIPVAAYPWQHMRGSIPVATYPWQHTRGNIPVAT